MIVNSAQQLQTYRQAAQISTQIMDQLRLAVKAGVYPIKLDQLAGKLCQQYQVKPAFKGVINKNLTYQHNSCISVNDEILHGIPDDERALQAGDLVKIDFGIIYQGLYTDHCITVGIEPVSKEEQNLLTVGRTAVLNAVRLATPKHTAGDLGHAMHQTAFRAGYEVLKQYVGHGIGQQLHQFPEIPAYGREKTGAQLEKNMIVCVECQVIAGDDDVYVDESGWTVKTNDGSKGVMFEYMVRVDEKPEILTPTQNWPLTVGS